MTDAAIQTVGAFRWGSPPPAPLLVLGDAAALLAERTGRSVVRAGSTADAIGRWKTGVFVAVLADPEASLALAQSGVRTIIISSTDMLDEAERALEAGAADVLEWSATQAEIEEVLSGAAPDRASVRETSGLYGANLVELSAEAGKIARALEALARQEQSGGDTPAPTITAPYIRGVIRTRRAREHFFKGELFADPAWDILLDLAAARLERKQVSVSSLCIAASVPPTTALRWIKGMTDEGLLERKPDPIDGRRIFIDLSDAAWDAMRSYLAQASRAAPI